MAITAPPTITALPAAPDPNDRATFNSRAYPWSVAQATLATEVGAVASNVFNNATEAQTQAATATTQAGTATTQAVVATTKASEAVASALSAINAPGTNATSTTSLSVGTGSKSLAIQVGKSLVVGMSVVIACTTAPANRIIGTITNYNSGTGALDVDATYFEGSGTFSTWTISLTAVAAYVAIPQNSQSTNYTLLASDAGKHILHPSADTAARTYTIPANVLVPYSIGTAITFVNQAYAGILTISVGGTDVMRLAGPGTTGSRFLAANGVATAIKITATEWIISGTWLT